MRERALGAVQSIKRIANAIYASEEDRRCQGGVNGPRIYIHMIQRCISTFCNKAGLETVSGEVSMLASSRLRYIKKKPQSQQAVYLRDSFGESAGF